MYSGDGIAFDGKDSWSFGNDYARNVVIFGVDTSSSSHIDNPQNKFLILGEGDTFGINGSFGAQDKKFSINFSKAKTKFCLSLHYNGDNSYLFVNGKEIYKFKASNKNVNIVTQFCLQRITNKFNHVDAEEIYLKGNIYDFSIGCNAIHKSDILDIHKYVILKNNMK